MAESVVDATTADAAAGWAEEELSIERRGIDPVPDSARYGTTWRLFTVWFAPQVTPVSFFLGALGPAFGLSFWVTVGAILVGNIVGALPVAWASTWGPKSGMAQMALSRTAFGKSVRVVSGLNWLTTLAWQAFDNVFGAAALKLLLHIPFWLGVVIILGSQVTVGIMGYEAVHRLQRYMTWILGAVFIYLTIRIITGDGTTHIASSLHGAALVGTFMLMVAAVLGYMFTWTPYAADYSRYIPRDARSSSVFGAAFFGLVLSASWIMILGTAVAGPILNGGLTGSVNVIRDIMGGGVLGVVGLITVFLSIVAVNTLDDYSASLSMQAAGIRLIRPLAAALSDSLALILSLVFIYASASLPSKAENFLLFISYWIAAWLGIVAVDWIRRKGRVDQLAIQNEAALHSGWPALVALIVGFVAALPFSNTTIGYNWVTGHPHAWARYLFGSFAQNQLHGADIGFFVGFVVAAVVYTILDRRKSPQEMYLPAAAIAG